MQISQHVRARGERWQLVALVPYENCALASLSRIAHDLSSSNRSDTCQLLTPFDRIDPIAPSTRIRFAGSRRWRRRCRALLATDHPPGRLRSAAGARIDLLPHQLEPALAVVRGTGTRILLADDVGLGKTIQAGLIISELFARSAAERLLVLTPAGLRDQWAGELRDRFGIETQIADAATLRSLTADLPIGINPWTTTT